MVSKSVYPPTVNFNQYVPVFFTNRDGEEAPVLHWYCAAGLKALSRIESPSQSVVSFPRFSVGGAATVLNTVSLLSTELVNERSGSPSPSISPMNHEKSIVDAYCRQQQIASQPHRRRTASGNRGPSQQVVALCKSAGESTNSRQRESVPRGQLLAGHK